jgi:hypothetical protein
MDHASVKVVHQVVQLQQAVVPIALLDISQRLLQRQNARHVQRDMHKKVLWDSSVYHVFLENLIIKMGSQPVLRVLSIPKQWHRMLQRVWHVIVGNLHGRGA